MKTDQAAFTASSFSSWLNHRTSKICIFYVQQHNFKLTVLIVKAKGYIYFILIQFKIQKAITNHSIYCNSWHSSSKLNFDIFCERVDGGHGQPSGRFLLWRGSAMMSRKIPSSSWYCLQFIHNQIRILYWSWVWSLELHPKTSVISPCHILWTLWKVHFITWIINSVSANPTSCTSSLMLGRITARPGPASAQDGWWSGLMCWWNRTLDVSDSNCLIWNKSKGSTSNT